MCHTVTIACPPVRMHRDGAIWQLDDCCPQPWLELLWCDIAFAHQRIDAITRLCRLAMCYAAPARTATHIAHFTPPKCIRIGDKSAVGIPNYAKHHHTMTLLSPSRLSIMSCTFFRVGPLANWLCGSRLMTGTMTTGQLNPLPKLMASIQGTRCLLINFKTYSPNRHSCRFLISRLLYECLG